MFPKHWLGLSLRHTARESRFTDSFEKDKRIPRSSPIAGRQHFATISQLQINHSIAEFAEPSKTSILYLKTYFLSHDELSTLFWRSSLIQQDFH
jgi:hypothetical protein